MKTARVVAVLFLVSAAALAQSNPELIKQARKLTSEGQQEQALTIYNQVLKADPDSFDANLGAGIVLDLQGKYDEARRHLASAIELAPPELKRRALVTMAMSYAFTCDTTQVAKYEQQVFDQQLAQKSYFSAGEAADELARVYLECGDLNSAEHWYQTGHDTGLKQPDIKPATVDLWNFRLEHAKARIAARRGQRTQAENHVAAAKAILDKGTIPEQAKFFPYLQGYVAYYLGDNSAAITDLQKADQRDPFILVMLAQAYEKAGDKTQALDYYRKVLSVNSHNPTNAYARPLAKKKLS